MVDRRWSMVDPSPQPSPQRREGEGEGGESRVTSHESPITRLRALSVSRRVHDYLQHPHSGSVVATFTRSCYLDLDGQIIALVGPELLNGPINIVVSLPQEFTFKEFSPATTTISTPESIYVEGCARVALDSKDIWDGKITPWHREEATTTLRDNLMVVKSTLLEETPEESLAHLLAHDQTSSARPDALTIRAGRAMERLRFGLQHGVPESVADAAHQLSGLGPGLTPSGDDILVGVLVALAVLHLEDAEALREAIITSASGRTTRISEAYLKSAARGEASEPWHRLLGALPEKHSATVVPAAQRVLAFGETSGADMLAGFMLAMQALTNGGPSGS